MDFLASIPGVPTLQTHFANSLERFDQHFSTWRSWQIFLCGAGVASGVLYVYRTYHYLQSSPGKRRLYHLMRSLPGVENKINEEIEQVYKDVHQSVHKNDEKMVFQTQLPPGGMTKDKLLTEAGDRVGLETLDINNGKLSGTIFGDNPPDLQEALQKVFSMFAFSNPLHADVFPGARKMEAEVVRMVCDLYNGDENTCGVVTTGGTESLLLACLAYRNRAYARGIRNPEMVMPDTAHPTFDKAGYYYGIKVIHVPVSERTGKVLTRDMKRYITRNTCMIVGSVPTFPHGVIDPIDEIAQLGLDYDIPVHVDACYGSFIVPFLEELNRWTKAPFDFRVPGVTSISCDTHKYGLTPKGTSVLMYRDTSYRHEQFFAFTTWPGGIYASSTTGGSKSGCNTALTWATLMYYGHKGYSEAAERVLATTKKLRARIEQLPYFRLIGDSETSVVAFTSDQLNMYAIIDDMGSRGWRINAIQKPPGLVLCPECYTPPCQE